MTKSKEELKAEKLEELYDKIEPMADNLINDTKYSAFRSQPVRRGLSVLLIMSCLGLAWASSFSVTSLVIWVAFIGLSTLLYNVGRGLMDLPNEFLDDRIIETRGEVYRIAFLAILVAVITIPLMMMIEMPFGHTLFRTKPINGLIALITTVFSLPTAIFAWQEKEI